MAYSTIPKGTLYMNSLQYTGNDSASHAITGVGFEPDWVWNKVRGTGNHGLWDRVRGVSKRIQSDQPSAETTTSGVDSFDTDGFTMGTSYNVNGDNYVSWNWRASGSTVSDSNGDITSTVSANTTSGFSIVKYTGNGSTATVGHGLGVPPEVVIVKNYSGNYNWISYWEVLGNTKYLEFNLTNGSGTGSEWNNTSPTNLVFSLGNTGSGNNNGDYHVAYCFASIKGFSKAGKYMGNANSSGPYIFTGFAPQYVLIKKDGGDGWWIIDKTQGNILPNPNTQMLVSNTNAGDNNSVSPFINFYSNGFALTSTWAGVNGNGSDYVYLAFAENPFVATSGSSSVPVTAR